LAYLGAFTSPKMVQFLVDTRSNLITSHPYTVRQTHGPMKVSVARGLCRTTTVNAGSHGATTTARAVGYPISVRVIPINRRGYV